MKVVQARTTLYRSSSWAVIDFACHAPVHPAGDEEASNAHAIVFVRSGAFVRTCGAHSTLAEPTRVLFFTRDQPYRVAHPIPGGDECTVLRVADETLMNIQAQHAAGRRATPDAPFLRMDAPTTPRSMLLHCQLFTRLREPAPAALSIDELVLELVDEVLTGRSRPDAIGRTSESSTVSREHRDLAMAAKTILTERYQTPPSLDELARALDCSPFHLSRVFSRVVGVPMRRYLDRLRLRLSLIRLVTERQDLTTLALELGYADHSHFTNAFRREFGMPPSAVRARPLARAAREGKNLQARLAPGG